MDKKGDKSDTIGEAPRRRRLFDFKGAEIKDIVIDEEDCRIARMLRDIEIDRNIDNLNISSDRKRKRREEYGIE